MRSVRTILAAAVTISAMSLGSYAAEPPPAPAPSNPTPSAAPSPAAAQPAVAAPAPQAANLHGPVDQIQNSASPSEAVAAYARLSAAQPNDTALEQAYVRRMVDFGMPELAEAQSQDLVNRKVNDGLAIGVGSYMSAAKGEYGAAIQQLKMALTLSPDEPFLLRTAGQTVAWYDSQLDRSKLTSTDSQALEWIRSNTANKPGYADAYKSASQPPQQQQAAPATQPAGEVPNASPYVYGGYTAPYPLYTNGYYSGYDGGPYYGSGYYGPYYSASPYYSSAYYPNPYYYCGGYYGGFVGVIVSGHYHPYFHNPFFEHHFHGDFDHHRHDFVPFEPARRPFVSHDGSSFFHGTFHDQFHGSQTDGRSPAFVPFHPNEHMSGNGGARFGNPSGGFHTEGHASSPPAGQPGPSGGSRSSGGSFGGSRGGDGGRSDGGHDGGHR